MSSLLRVLVFARAVRGRLALAVLTGALALGAAVGLMATSAWLISRAAEHPPMLTLMVAIAAVRALSIGRGVLRYAERLVGHGAALGVLRELRVAVWKRLEVIAPAGLPEYRSGDLLTRLVADVDAVADVLLRVMIPAAVAVVAGAGTVALVYWLLPSAALTLLVTMLFAAVAVPWLIARAGRRTEQRLVPLRGRLTALAVELIHGAPDLIAFGASRRRLSLLASLDGELAKAQACSARTTGLAAGLTALAAGLAGWAALALGISAVHAGAFSGVALAVVVLIPLAAFEGVTMLPPAVQHLQRGRRSVDRVSEVLDRVAPVRERRRPSHCRRRPTRFGWWGYGPTGPGPAHRLSTEWTWNSDQAGGWRWWARAVQARPPWSRCWCGFSIRARARSPSTGPTSPHSPATTYAV